MNVEIRRLRPDDDALVMPVAEGVFDEPIRPDRLAAYLASPGHFMIVAIIDEIVVGQCAAVIHRHPDKASELYIDEVGVAPPFQRQGIARKMLDAMFERAASMAARRRGSGPSRTTGRRGRFMKR
ncbi:GNAT family N-acetyltransferase [Mesorhizobium sp.]|uniref:GNAT family N-acetyltransferase n=1 Tax=Mesorhizobium sp. TaxID=1871066 RepID=UPI002603984D|nr:GNAT family N-acetyltransferase [Mesorhizobium sp.]